MKFTEGVDYIKTKKVLLPDKFYQLNPCERSLCFTVSGVSDLKIIRAIKKLLIKSLKIGATVNNFRKKVDELLDGFNMSRLDREHCQRIFGINAALAYSVERYQQMTSPSGIIAFPYWRYVAIIDPSTHPEHAAMNGKIFPADHPIWNVWFPPNSIDCRCYVMEVSASKLKRRGWQVENKLPSGCADPEFSYNPGKIFMERIKNLD